MAVIDTPSTVDLDDFTQYDGLLSQLQDWLEDGEDVKSVAAKPLKPKFKRGKAYVANMDFRVRTNRDRVRVFSVKFDTPLIYPVLAP